MDYKIRYDEARKALSEWACRTGQDRCFWHPDILEKIAGILNVSLPDEAFDRPCFLDFKKGCERYWQLKYPERFKEGAD